MFVRFRPMNAATKSGARRTLLCCLVLGAIATRALTGEQSENTPADGWVTPTIQLWGKHANATGSGIPFSSFRRFACEYKGRSVREPGTGRVIPLLDPRGALSRACRDFDALQGALISVSDPQSDRTSRSFFVDARESASTYSKTMLSELMGEYEWPGVFLTLDTYLAGAILQLCNVWSSQDWAMFRNCSQNTHTVLAEFQAALDSTLADFASEDADAGRALFFEQLKQFGVHSPNAAWLLVDGCDAWDANKMIWRAHFVVVHHTAPEVLVAGCMSDMDSYGYARWPAAASGTAEESEIVIWVRKDFTAVGRASAGRRRSKVMDDERPIPKEPVLPSLSQDAGAPPAGAPPCLASAVRRRDAHCTSVASLVPLLPGIAAPALEVLNVHLLHGAVGSDGLLATNYPVANFHVAGCVLGLSCYALVQCLREHGRSSKPCSDIASEPLIEFAPRKSGLQKFAVSLVTKDGRLLHTSAPTEFKMLPVVYADGVGVAQVSMQLPGTITFTSQNIEMNNLFPVPRAGPPCSYRQS